MTYKEKLEELMQKYTQITGKQLEESYKISEKSSSADFSGYVLKSMEADFNNANRMGREYDPHADLESVHRLQICEKYLSEIVKDDEEKRKNKQPVSPLSERTQKNNVILHGFTSYFQDNPVIMKTLDGGKNISKNIGKTFSFDIDRVMENDESFLKRLNFSATNDSLTSVFSPKQIQDIIEILPEHLSNDAGGVREGACSAVYSMMVDRGVTLEDIANNNISKSIAQSVYDDIRALRDTQAQLNSAGSDIEKGIYQKEYDRASNRVFNSFTNGYRIIVDDFDKTVRYEDTKDISKVSSAYNNISRLASSVINNVSTNYSQDRKFLERMEKSYERNSNLKFDDKPFRIDTSYNKVVDKASLSIRYSNLVERVRGMNDIEKSKDSPTNLMSFYMVSQMDMNCKFPTEAGRFYLAQKADYAIFGRDELDDIEDDFGWRCYARNMFKEGKLFNDMRVNPATGELKSKHTLNDILKDHEKYMKTKFAGDVVKAFGRAIGDDITENSSSWEQSDDQKQGPGYPKNAQALIKASYVSVLEELKKTVEFDNENKPKGNTEYFNNMYKSISEIAEAEEGCPDFLEKFQKAQRDIDAYVQKRDRLIKFTSKGSNRLALAKQLKGINDGISEEFEINVNSMRYAADQKKKDENHKEKESYSEDKSKQKQTQKIVEKDLSLDNVKGMN